MQSHSERKPPRPTVCEPQDAAALEALSPVCGCLKRTPVDEAVYGFGLLFAVLMTVLAQIPALRLGVAGLLQRRNERLFALLGVVCGVLVLASFVAVVGLETIAEFFASLGEPTPRLRIVPPGNE